MDPRGYGASGGIRSFMESEEIYMEDHLSFIDKMDAKFGDGLPRLQMGYSLGGTVSLRLAAIRPDYFKGLGLVAPYLGIVDSEQ